MKISGPKKNAWRACSVVCDRLQGASASTTGETIKAHVADHPRLGFFWNEVEWLDFLSAKEASQASQPGYHYFKRIQEFVVTHYDIGVKYMEYHRDAVCSFHNIQLMCFVLNSCSCLLLLLVSRKALSVSLGTLDFHWPSGVKVSKTCARSSCFFAARNTLFPSLGSNAHRGKALRRHVPNHATEACV